MEREVTLINIWLRKITIIIHNSAYVQFTQNLIDVKDSCAAYWLFASNELGNNKIHESGLQ